MREDEEVPEDAAAVRAWLKTLRENAGFSQEAAAAAVGTDESSIRRWENQHAPGSVKFLKLLSAYGVTLVPPAPEDIPKALNVELALMRKQIADSAALMVGLTDLELRILRLYLDGLSFEQIADQAELSLEEVELMFAAMSEKVKERTSNPTGGLQRGSVPSAAVTEARKSAVKERTARAKRKAEDL